MSNTLFESFTISVYFKAYDLPEEFSYKIKVQSIVFFFFISNFQKTEEDCQWICDNCFVIMNDIMSALPHDKIRIPYGTKGSSITEYQQCVVMPRGTGYEELYMSFSLYKLIVQASIRSSDERIR